MTSERDHLYATVCNAVLEALNEAQDGIILDEALVIASSAANDVADHVYPPPDKPQADAPLEKEMIAAEA